MMKKLLMVVIAGLLIWNIVLTYQLVRVNNLAKSIGGDSLIKQSVTEFDTDITEVVSKTAAKVVGITSRSSYSAINGSGVIYGANSEEVIIVTNNHILSNSGTIYVTFVNDIVLEAELVGKDPVSDLVVLKVKPDFNVEAFVLGDSAVSKTGEWVVMISNPSGEQYAGSYAITILSSKDKVLLKDINNDENADWELLLLQLATQVYSSNSGAAVVNMAGELIGITSSRLTAATFDGLGFAVPINEVKTIVNQILTNGEVNRTTMGVSLKDLSEIPVYLKSYNQIKLDIEGVLITNVFDQQPADLAGLAKGDVITQIDGRKMLSNKDIRNYLVTKMRDDVIEVTYVRNDVIASVNVTLR